MIFREQYAIIQTKKFPNKEKKQMQNNFEIIQNLLRTKAELQARLNLIPYDGTVEIKEISNKKYLYIRKREAGRVKSTYVGLYSDDLYQILLTGAKNAKEIKKQVRKINKELAVLGYTQEELTPAVALNIDFARANMKLSIYEQAVLEGIATTFPDTELIIDNGKVNNVSAEDVQKILNLKHAWEFILDDGVIQAPTNYYVCQYIAKFVNEGFYQDGGRIRGVPVKIGGTNYLPPLPIESVVKEDITTIVNSNQSVSEIAVELALYVMKKQIFNDGNKRTAIIFANHYLISNAGGLLVVPENAVPQFKKFLVDYYEERDIQSVKNFLLDKCLKRF